MITKQYLEVKEQMAEACRAVGRPEDSVTLVAVSKTKPVEDIQEIYDAGQRDFGENKVQEWQSKVDALPSDIRWHIIGHLQTNKVKYIVGRVALIHSVDSVRLAQKIEDESEKKGCISEILIQVNLCREESKSGVDPDDLDALLRACSGMPHVKVRGLMLIPPFDLTDEGLAAVFDEFYALRLDIAGENLDNINMDILSFGMSGDFQTAIRHHSNMVRVGTNIFGRRNYN